MPVSPLSRSTDQPGSLSPADADRGDARALRETGGPTAAPAALPLGEPASTGRGSVLFTRPALLASSWTWLIGMYLPVLLLDQYGSAGVIAFAIPNVIGVMLFGLALTRFRWLRELPATHPWMPVVFSLVVVAFHAYVLTWLWRWEVNRTLPEWTGLAPMSVVIVLGVFATILPERWIVRGGAAAWCISLSLLLAALASWLMLGDVSFIDANAFQQWLMVMFDLADGDRPAKWMPAAEHPLPATLLLSPIMIFGFLLCPYLDLTFHRSFNAVGGGRPGATTFVMFGVLFTCMIAFTAVYAVLGFGPAVALHIVLQSWITVALHLREIDRASRPQMRGGGLLLALLAAVTGAGLAFVEQPLYREWFVFYGLIFPAWLLLQILKPRLLGRKAVGGLTFLVVCLLCAPFLQWGFMRPEHNAVLLVPVVLLALAFLVGPRTDVRAA